MRSDKEMALEELQRRSKRPRSALHDLIKEEPQRPQSALRDLLDPVTGQPETDYRTSAFGNHLTGRIAGKN